DDTFILLHYGVFRYIYELLPDRDIKKKRENIFVRLGENIFPDGRRIKSRKRRTDIPGIVVDPDELRDMKPSLQAFHSMVGASEPPKSHVMSDLPFVCGNSAHIAQVMVAYHLLRNRKLMPDDPLI